MSGPARRGAAAIRKVPKRAGQAGLSLGEILVAIAVLAVASVIALSLHDSARRSVKKGENAAEQQQTVRIAFDRLTTDLRMAGHNANPDGDAARPDEPIEGAFDTAIVIRADFDADDPSASATPEAALATGGAFATVSTGNDEIVTYVLARPDGTSADTLTFFADVGSPRTGVVRRVDIPRVSLAQGDPPYTLYRITLGNSDGSPVRMPLAENVRSLRFSYHGWDGVPMAGPGGADSAGAKAARGVVRRITVELSGLTRDPDPGWEDAEDPDPRTRAYRKFRLAGDVAPRNLGLKGLPDP